MGKYGVLISVSEDIIVVLGTYMYSRFAVYWRVLFVPAETKQKISSPNLNTRKSM